MDLSATYQPLNVSALWDAKAGDAQRRQANPATLEWARTATQDSFEKKQSPTAGSWKEFSDPKVQQQNAPGSDKGDELVKVAEQEIGVKEKTGNNDGLPSERYANGRQEPWCADFVTWCVDKVDKDAADKYGSPSVYQMQSKLDQDGKLHDPSQHNPEPGDVIFFKSKKQRHVGIVEKVEDGQVHTIEGNASNQVKRRSYTLEDPRITGYGTP